jgi:2-deoxy-D-gluconate 3-dehydrogenase
MQKHGRLDALVNNVGMNLLTPSIADTETSLWQKIMDTNLNGTFLCARRAARIMRPQKGGKIVTVSSIAGRKASPGMGVYGIAKAGVEMLTRVLASELASSNIQVNAVAPSMVRTEFSKPFWSNDIIYEQVVKGIPLGRIAEPMDVVHPVLFLASDAADFITGQTSSTAAPRPSEGQSLHEDSRNRHRVHHGQGGHRGGRGDPGVQGHLHGLQRGTGGPEGLRGTPC